MADKALPSPDVLRQLLRYEPETGNLFWTARGQSKWWDTKYAGTLALHCMNARGYRLGSIFNVKFTAHRVIFAMIHSRWPLGDVDHIDGNPLNNRISNLRDVSRAENTRNASIRPSNRSGVVGVGWRAREGKWCAQIGIAGKCVFLGYFDSMSDAVEVRKAAEFSYGFHSNHGRPQIVGGASNG